MNLYDKDDGFKCFTLDEANTLLKSVISVTENAITMLERSQNRIKEEPFVEASVREDRLKDEASKILDGWSRDIVQLGAYPKGYFTVDFKSPVPDTLFCWTFGEVKITHTHRVFESFKDRVPIRDEDKIGFQDSLN